MTDSIENIWNEFSEQLGRFIRARVADPATAEDLLQDVFIKFQMRYEHLRDPTKLRGWLLLVARNAIIDYYRTRKNTCELDGSLPDESTDSGTEEKELRAVFHRLLHGLPQPYREALLLTEFEGLTQEQLAKRLGISLSGAKSRVQRGRDQLKELLLAYCHKEFSRTVGAQPCPKGLVPTVGSTETRNGPTFTAYRRKPKRN